MGTSPIAYLAGVAGRCKGERFASRVELHQLEPDVAASARGVPQRERGATGGEKGRGGLPPSVAVRTGSWSRSTMAKTKDDVPREGLFNLLLRESDRGAMLVAGEALNELLGELLSRLFVDDKASLELLDGGSRGALGSFSARAEACFALGLISVAERNDLAKIRKLRNEAAHFGHGNVFSFDHARTWDRCKELKAKAPTFFTPDHAEREAGRRGIFVGKWLGLYQSIGARKVVRARTPT